MISLWAMQGIIINRLWCMYRRSRLVITLLMTALFAEAASSIFVVALNFRLETRITELNSYRDMCFPTGFDTHFYVFWIFILAFDALIFTLAFLEAIKYIRESQARRALHQGSERSFLNSDSWPWVSRHGNFVQVLLRDSIVFPFITLVSCLLNILAWFQVLPYGWLQNTLNLSAVCSPILGCRLVLNLRELYYEPFAAEFRVSNRGENAAIDGHGQHFLDDRERERADCRSPSFLLVLAEIPTWRALPTLSHPISNIWIVDS
ncbi:hypothetical protein CC2G_003359 [Coprinopsis cinerea AmutBmut pab1-1]|nr:hypothetical protein CC2G_003359 [Coprinopsis cinerea AmutBmut pab1-1]